MRDSDPVSASGFAWRRYLERSAASAKVVAVLLASAVSTRFAIASVQHALAVSQGNFVESPTPHASAAPRAPGSAPQPERLRAGGPPPPTASAGQPRSVTLGVSAGPPRSDVYVNAQKVGQTPFLGSTSCKTGQRIRIEIVPPKGPPLVYFRDCVGGALEVDGPPP